MDDVLKALDGMSWRPIRVLGKGGGGVVYLCANASIIGDLESFSAASSPAQRTATALPLVEKLFDAVLKRHGLVAVKIPHQENDSMRARTRREIEAMERYRHSAFIRLIDSDRQADGPKWFAVEYHQHGALQNTSNRQPYLANPLMALTALRPIVQALGRLHRDGAVHKDVKPNNIFVADDGRLVLGDFGVVLPSPDATRLTEGDPAHSKDWVPDWVQFGDDRTYTPVVDVFALAKVIHYLIAGENVMASQIAASLNKLRRRCAATPKADETLNLLERCIVIHDEDLEIRTGDALLNEIDTILLTDPRPHGHLIFSYVAGIGRNDEGPTLALAMRGNQLPAVSGLNQIRFFLNRPPREFKALTQLRGRNGTIQFGVDSLLSSVAEFKGSGDPTRNTDEWIEISLSVPSGFGPGLHNLCVYGCGSSTEIRAFSVYAI